MAAEILVEFVPDFTKLESSIDELVSSGVITKEIAAEFKKAQKPIDDLAKKIKSSSASQNKDLESTRQKLKQLSKDMSTGFKEGMKQALDEAGVSIEEFENKLNEVIGTEKSLKSELKEITMQMAKLKVEGKDNTEQYEQLVQKAGQYRDALGDVSAEINRVASDTQGLDTAINAVQGVAAAFQIGAGAAALFGDESKEIQEVLVQLNAVMAITQGLQQIQNLLQKESNLIRAVTNIQLKASVAITNLETAAQSKNIIVKYGAIAAQKILNFVMSLNPAFILVAAFTALAGALLLFSNRAQDSADRAEELNKALGDTKRATDESLKNIKNAAEKEDALLDAQGAKQSERLKARLANIQKENNKLLPAFRKLEQEFESTDAKIKSGALKETDELKEAQSGLIKQMQEFQDQFLENNQAIAVGRINLTKLLKEEAEKEAEDAEKAAKERADKLAAIREEERQQVLASIRRKLLDAEAGSEQELTLQKQLAIKEALFLIEKEKLVGDRKKEVLRKVQLEIDELDKKFNNQRATRQLENEASLLNAQLQSLNLAADEREKITVEFLEKQRQLELAAVINNKTKEKEINAKFDAQIAEQRLAIRASAFQKELDLATTQGAAEVRALQAIKDSQTSTESQKLAAEEALLNKQLESINKRRDFTMDAFNDQLLSAVDYNLEMAKLDDEEKQAHEKSEKEQTDITKSESEKRKEQRKKDQQDLIEFASLTSGIIDNIFSVIQGREDARIAAQKAEVERLREGNAITEKEAEARLKKIDRQEKEAKRRQAIREKGLAVFNAFINGAAAVIEAAPNPFLIALTIALVAAQSAAILARPIPQFGKGVKRAPKGFAEVGETGTELIQTDSGYYIADYPQVIWMKGGERVYNPHETNQIFNTITPDANENLVNVPRDTSSQFNIDYDKLSKAIGHEIASHPRNIINFDEEGFSTYHVNKSNKTKMLNKKYTFND